VLEPQLRFELARLLPWYVRLEKVLLLEYRRLGLLTDPQVTSLAAVLDEATPQLVGDCAGAAMSDLAFALERFVAGRLADVPPAWHVDRSRNDLQASAHMLHYRDRILEVTDHLWVLGRAAHTLAGRTAGLVMPGYTHGQPAQVISPGYYLAALSQQILDALGRLEAGYRAASASPMGAGAMAGQELPWDRARMARLLGCEDVQTHALRAVAGRDWALVVTAELSNLGVALSRFVTDLLLWGGAEHGFIDLPDEWSGISSAMPQKKNFPVLERIRARTAHLTAGYLAIATAQRSTTFSNNVEVSKEAGAHLPGVLDATVSIARLFTGVLEALEFNTGRMRAAGEAAYLGGLTLANLLTLREGVPWRTAQVIAGRFVVRSADEAKDKGGGVRASDGELLRRTAAEAGHDLADAADLLVSAFDVDGAMTAKRTPGSTNPEAVRRMLADQQLAFDRSRDRWTEYRRRIEAASAELDRLFAVAADGQS
jgi:argininosuccinate lyase